LRATNGAEMKNRLSVLLVDRQLAAHLTEAGLQAIAARHTCRHRALELLGIAESIRGAPVSAAQANQAEELA
jgi:spore maturation protein CgeB